MPKEVDGNAVDRMSCALLDEVNGTFRGSRITFRASKEDATMRSGTFLTMKGDGKCMVSPDVGDTVVIPPVRIEFPDKQTLSRKISDMNRNKRFVAVLVGGDESGLPRVDVVDFLVMKGSGKVLVRTDDSSEEYEIRPKRIAKPFTNYLEAGAFKEAVQSAAATRYAARAAEKASEKAKGTTDDT
jgi:hypothetical protein